MTESGYRRERRRKLNALRWLVFVVAVSAGLTIKLGWYVIAVLVVVLALLGSVVEIVAWCGRRAEARRRAGGAAPSWAAHLAGEAARRSGASVPSRFAGSELPGRLSYGDGELRWMPNRTLARNNVPELCWGRGWVPEVTSLPGLTRPGCLTLTRDDGIAIDVWVRDPDDLRRVLGLERNAGTAARH